jgi:transcriptional regulator with XRE-family HTH domain
MRREYTYSRQARAALELLGVEIARGRRARRWTVADLAERAGISAPTLRAVERGEPTVGIGTVFELATLVGLQLFGLDAPGLASATARARDRLAVLPARVREPASPLKQDF